MNYNRDFLRYFGEVEIVHKTPGRMMDDKKQSSERSYDVMYFPVSKFIAESETLSLDELKTVPNQKEKSYPSICLFRNES